MDEKERIQHQIDLATRAEAFVKDETTIQRLRSLAEDLKRRLLRMMRRGKVRTRAYELWEQAGRPENRDLEFWVEAERQIAQDHDDRNNLGGSSH